MKNSDIAHIFQDIADLLEIKGENKFKIRAYQKVARSIADFPQEIETMVESGEKLSEIPGVGTAIAGKITEMVKTGKLEYYEDLKAEFPAGINTLLEIPGIGPKTARKLIDSGVDSVDELEKAIVEGRIASIFRLGDKTVENILRQIQALRHKDQRIPIGSALMMVDEIFAALRKIPGVRNLTTAGSLRRFRDTVGDIDLMGTADNPETVIAAFISLPQVKEVLGHGPTKASAVLESGLQADLRMAEHDSFGSLLQYFTGSKQHNIALRTREQKRGLRLSEYGITDISSNVLEKFATEEDFYGRLGLQYIPPEIREGTQEIELAGQGKIPRLIELVDIKGDFHIHTDWSDGQESIKDMVLTAKSLGYKFIAITDHSGGLGVAHGLNADRLRQQIAEVKAVNEKIKGIQVLTGMEVDIRSDGSMDLPQDLLAELDVVIGAVHSGLHQSVDKMTRRILKALENPDLDILAHPTGRLIGSREAVALDMEAVFATAVKHNKALEINAMPSRLDLKDVHIQRAIELGIKLVMGTDAHHSEQLAFMRFGVGTARRGWCQKQNIMNTWSVAEILKFLRR